MLELTTEQPRYFIRSNRKRTRLNTANTTSIADEESNIKRVRVIIVQLLSKDSSNLDFEFNELEGYLFQYNNSFKIMFEAAFPVEVIAGIRIPRIYKEAIEDLKHAQQWRTVIAKEILTLYTNGTFEEVVPPKGANLVLYKQVFTVKITLSRILNRFKARLIA